MKRAYLITAVFVAALALASGAFASSVTTGHGSTPAKSATLGAKIVKKPAAKVLKKPAVKAAARANTLPFTGLDLAFAGFGGLALVGVGLTLRHTARRTNS